MFFYPKTVSLFSLLFFILMLAPPSFAEGGSPGLLAAKGLSVKPAEHSDLEDRLILLNASSSTGAEIRIGEVALIRIHKKTNIPSSGFLGFLIGGTSGALLGIASGDDIKKGTFAIFSFSAGEKACMGALALGLLGTLAGGIIGSLDGIKESIDMERLPPSALDQVLDKLKSYTRVF